METQSSGNSRVCCARPGDCLLNLDGVWSVLPNLSHCNVYSRRLGWTTTTSSDVLLLLKYKYDIIKKQLYKDMLQDEHGVAWWDSMEPQEQMDYLWELEEAVEHAFTQMDWLSVSKLPGALHCYRSSAEEGLQACDEVFKPRDQAWSSKPRKQAWSAVVFLSELESHYQEEHHTLTFLINSVDQNVLREMYLSMCVAVRRAEREAYPHMALLASRQHWDKWPFTRDLAFQELAEGWMQEKQDPTRTLQHHWKQAGSIQQAVLHCMVLCQEKERQGLLEILHTLTLKELQDQSHIVPSYNNTAEENINALRQSCVLILRQMKAFPHGVQESMTTCAPVSWADCAVHLITQLTLAHENEARTVVHTLPDMDASALRALLHKYEHELQFPTLQNLSELLKLHTSRGMDTMDTVPSTDNERIEQRINVPSFSEEQEICTGCGVVFVPEDAPYLEILGAKNPRQEASPGRSEQEKKDEKEIEREERRDCSKNEMNERTETEEVVIPVEKQGSLITQAWSKPDEGMSKDQVNTHSNETTPDIKDQVAAKQISTDSNTQNNTQPVYQELQHEKCISAAFQQNTKHDEAHGELHKHTLTAQDHTLIEPLQDPSTSSMGTLHEVNKADSVVKPEALEAKPTDTQTSGQMFTNDAVCEGEGSELLPESEACKAECEDSEEQQLQCEATMRSLVDIQRRAELRCQRDRERQIFRVQERLSIIRNRKSDEDLLGLTRENTYRQLTSTLQQEDEQQQKTLVREKLQQLWRERSCSLQYKRKRNTVEFKELLAPTAHRMNNGEDGLDACTNTNPDTH
ncbi:uncharacterized protein LOC134323651 isoform X2 [Trichomycterus rosablanca]|uniref:uncharacterized protein LOC134323651 isoform X2 n=1 Tax=Trichomycterus rosablanca TaxID=2290929 RepID=UPI002F35E904